MTLARGTILKGRYRILAALGEGGMGSVYQVEDLRRPGVLWALKELLNDGSTPPDEVAWAEKHFDAEITLMKKLHHPRIPTFHEDFTEGGRRCFLMEFIPGANLEERLERAHAPLPEPDILRWMDEVCDVLIYLHGQRPPIIVRDLKPGNIMVTPEGEARLIDFGIARTYKKGQASNTENLGTMIYASPEHLGRAQTDARSDIYSLGATMLHLLTNSEPIPMQTPPPGALRRLQPRLSKESEALIIKAMQLDPRQRFQSARELQDAIRASRARLDGTTGATAHADKSWVSALLGLGGAGAAPPTNPQTSSQPNPPQTGAPPTPPPAPRSIPPASQPAAPQPARAAYVAPQTAPSAARVAAPVAPAPASQPAPAGVICPRCGFVNRTTAKFCAQDGAPLTAGVAGMVAAPATHTIHTNGTSGPFATTGSALNTAELSQRRASDAFNGGRYAVAVKQCEAAIEQGRVTPEVYLLLGKAQRALGRPREAAEAFAQAARLRPTAEALTLEGVAWREALRPQEAQIALTRARQLDPRDPEIPYQLGLVCLDLGLLAQAEGEFHDALALRPDAAPALGGLGRVALARGQADAALERFHEAVTVAPQDANAQVALGRALLGLGRNAEAEAAFETALRLEPGSAQAHAALATLYQTSGRREQARAMARRAGELAPNDAEIQHLNATV